MGLSPFIFGLLRDLTPSSSSASGYFLPLLFLAFQVAVALVLTLVLNVYDYTHLGQVLNRNKKPEFIMSPYIISRKEHKKVVQSVYLDHRKNHFVLSSRNNDISHHLLIGKRNN